MPAKEPTAVAEPKLAAAAKAKKGSKPKKAFESAPKPRSTSSHPSYEQMIKDAIVTLKERTGSSQHAITKFIEEKHKQKLPANFRKLLLFRLKKLVAAEKLVKLKGSFKLPSKNAEKKPAAETAKPKPKPNATSKARDSKPKAAAVKAKPAAAKPKATAKRKAAPAKPKESPVKAARASKRASPAKKVAAGKKASGKSLKSPAKKKVAVKRGGKK